ncbi:MULTISPECIES: DUF2786 domain-containing protein [unclassified Modicisalibacter]|uniref:DUF2786 domain-containing protein n=1 Tax=unclassified Modicisalibacter TaxID=2679913 RepID=UPI001CCE023B|nr:MULTISPECIES: DUF2786 domain-containing protein [unclassified Modicisalibacter]MBZ9559034.1 DUF2786 domain-containing protein [Modicisalibacter sp. R2A 31.J]MBZ9576854.1 DUF2786 domain-containing protein [Modicisalibacter sp. MOD 31.J]
MIPDRNLRKIKRCLALSQSANAHEAGIALRQAQRLMAKYGLSEIDVAASTIERIVVPAAAGRTPPRWLGQLVVLVNASFGTLAVYEPHPALSGWQGYYAFLGESGQVRIAAYAFEVLQRQLVSDRKAFLAGMSKRAKRVTKTRRADAFACAWVSGAAEHIRPVEMGKEAIAAIDHFKTRFYTTLESLSTIDRGQRRDDRRAMMRGFEAGRNARFHDGVEADRREGLTHG